jgi:adenylate cyclase
VITSRVFKNILFSVAYWIAVSIFFVITRYGALRFDLDLENNAGILPDDIFSSVFFGLLAGIFLGFYESFESAIYKERRSFGFVLTTKTLIYILIFWVVTFIQVTVENNSLSSGIDFILTPDGIISLVNFAVYSLLFHLVRLMNKSMGPGILAEYLVGKYFNPREEDRIFLFIDLKSSTTIAEKIGHKTYSSLLQDCFENLTKPIIKHKGQVYQYVGDEVVVTWKTNEGIKDLNCLGFFFTFLEELEKKRRYFKNKYQVFPEFKAGMSSGMVTVAEVGELKSEISFHGDVLNTASRLQGLCNDYGKKMLISEFLNEELDNTDSFDIQFIGDLQLKGKERKVMIYSVDLF